MTDYTVTDLQAVEVEGLSTRTGIRVEVHPHLDFMGFNTVDISGPTPEAVVEYVRENWGDEDPAWFAEYVVARVGRRPA